MRYSFFLLCLFLVSCTYTAKVTDGATAVDRKQYDVAVPMLQREYKKAKTRKDKGQIAYNFGLALRETGQDEAAVDWFQKAFDNNAGPDALREKAAALKRLERYEEAIGVYTDLGFEIGSKYEFRKDIRGAELARQWREEEANGRPNPFTVATAGFNTRQSDYAPVAFEERLVFTSDRGSAVGDETFKWTGRGFTDLFVTDPAAGDAVSTFDDRINTPAHEGTPTFSADGTMMIFVRCVSPEKRTDAYCGLYRSERVGNGWGAATALPFVRAGYNYLHPALSPDGKRLFFSAQLEDGWGGYDLFVSERLVDGTWGEPTLLPRALNTQGNEQFPSWDADTLYFSSDGHEGMGGLDIFSTYKMANGRWSAPKNLRQPVNSGADDFAYTVLRRNGTGVGSETTGYFSSSRPGGEGADDIYVYTKRVLPPPPPDPTPVEYKNVLDVTVVEKIFQDPKDSQSPVLGLRPVPNATIIARVGDQSRTVSTDEEGRLSLVLVDDQNYEFRAERENYLAAEGAFSSRNLPRDPDAPKQRYEIELEIERIFPNEEIVLKNIYYDFDQSFIREDAQPTLNQLTALLERNPDIRIELGSHTDCRGKDGYNQQLSQARAQAAVTYLEQQGIAPARLEARGYGEEAPIAECVCERCSEAEHQQNRRTTFRILE